MVVFFYDKNEPKMHLDFKEKLHLVDRMEILDGQVGKKRSFMHSRRLDFVWENQHHWLDGFDDPKPELLSTQRHKSDIIS